MTVLITKFYEMEDNAKMDKDNVRTVAFQVPTELFEQLKAYLKRNGIKQNAFFLRWRRTPALVKNKKYIARTAAEILGSGFALEEPNVYLP